MIQQKKGYKKKFKYYRLSLYIYSLASFIEVMLLGNFQEEYLSQVKNVIQKHSEEYDQLYIVSSRYLDKMAGFAVEANVVKGIGIASKAVDEFIGSIPFIKEGPIDEWLIEGGSHLKQTSQDMKKKARIRFEAISDAGTSVFVQKFDDINRIYNHTSSICFDAERIYLLEC